MKPKTGYLSGMVLALVWAAGLVLLTTGCRATGSAGPPADSPPNPFNTRIAIDGVEKKDPVVQDLYSRRETPIVKIIKGRTVDRAEGIRLMQNSREENLKGMSQTLKSLVLRDVTVRRITELLTQLCGYNVVPTKQVENMKISTFMQDISLKTALETICRLNDLWYREGNNIVTLMTREEYVNDIEIRQSEHTRSFSVKYTNAADMAKIIQALMGSEVYLSEIEDEKVYGHVDPEEDVDLDGEFDGPDLDTSAQRIIFTDRLIRGLPPVTERAAVSRPDTAVPAPAGKNPVRATPDPTGGKRPLLAILTVFKRNNSIIARSLDETLLNEMARIIEVLDTPTSQVLLEVKILQITLGDEFESFFKLTYGDYSDTPVDSRINPGTQVFEGMGIETLPGAVTSGRTIAGVFSLNNIQARISFFEKEGRVNTISSPFLMCANNSKVDFFVGEEVPLRDDVKKETIPIGDAGDTINTFIVDVKREELGTDIEMSAFINEDNTVTMEIEAEISSPLFNMTSIGLFDDSGNVVEFPLDGINKSEIESILTAKSGQTIALGGIIRETIDNSVKKTPLLGDLPLVKHLFRQQYDQKKKTETVIVLTPHIINHPGLSGAETGHFLNRKSSHRTVLEGKENLLTD